MKNILKLNGFVLALHNDINKLFICKNIKYNILGKPETITIDQGCPTIFVNWIDAFNEAKKYEPMWNFTIYHTDFFKQIIK
jgi:hypothetical protein